MKRMLIAIVLLPFFVHAQESELPRTIDDTLFTTSGFNIVKGMDLKLGTGTLPNGDFKYLTENTSFSNLTGPNAGHPDPVNRKWNGHLFHVKKFRKDGNRKRGYKYYVIMGGGNIINYECDIESAISAGEIIVPDQFKKGAVSVTTAPQPDAMDRLKKLKELYDDGALTKDEYDSAKKKILSKL